ncbi:DUF6702 family protein [Algibacter sp. L4_22]|uniref:DUF6702 family protein n=1 Tax=Algibacter sp. L4_22 TaxID=2942477 RepID=UPI00201B69CB|nr:DUF6702 family protein [Algibacter sp. L4_22]MCL5129847.1 peptidase E [Algibacter sp. L4_22]
MNRFKIVLLLSVFSFFSFTGMHKYYISVTQIEFVKEKQSVQIISRVFIDDLEKALRHNYDENITLDENKEADSINGYMEEYVNNNLVISINKEPAQLQFVGKEYDGDIVRFYLEIIDVEEVKDFDVSNKMLFDVCTDQQNIVKTKINAKQKSIILTKKNDSALLNFN